MRFILIPLTAALVSLLLGCGHSSESQPAAVTASAAEWTPLPPAAPVSAQVQAAREALLGPDPTNPQQVNIWWAGVSSFVTAIGGHLFLFDAWEPIGLQAGYVPFTRDDLAALQPEAILVGHGHFDHAADVGYVAGRSGAAVIGGDTVCDTARARAAELPDARDFACLVLGNDDSPGPGHVQSVKIWADLPPVTVIQHTHSAANPADLLSGGKPLLFVPDVLSYLTHLNTDPRVTQRFAESLFDDGLVGQPHGGTWAYHLRIADFSLLWYDSTGPISDGSAPSNAITAALQNLPGCVDVQLGAIVGFGMVTSALRDAVDYVDAARPQLSLPSHHDAWLPVLGGGAAAYETQWRDALAQLPFAPELDYLRDPQDYLSARRYDLRDPRWRNPPPGSRCAADAD